MEGRKEFVVTITMTQLEEYIKIKTKYDTIKSYIESTGYADKDILMLIINSGVKKEDK